jgi:hypothetical protein
MSHVFEAIQRLDLWIMRNGWSGWDPYDIKENRFISKIVKLPPSLLNKIIRKFLFATIDLNPLSARKIFDVRPRVNAKGMGLFLAGYSNLYKVTAQKEYLKKAHECAEWLIQNRCSDYSGWSWGYPFDWQSVIFIPKGTPSSVVTSTVGDGIFRLYKCTGDRRYLSICRDICSFFINDLKKTHQDEYSTCFSYTPIDDFQVHNANLFVGEFLARIGKETADTKLTEQGIRCGNFALCEQQPEGFLPYWSLSQTDSHSGGKIRTDHYHSGFEIRMLYGLWKSTEDERFRKACRKYFRWYIENMFEKKIIPKLTPSSKYPVNIHSCAEAILCQATLLDEFPEREQDLKKTFEWIIGNMEYAAGQYTYLIKKLPLIGEWRLNIPMMRWGQAWILRAYSELLVQCKEIAKPVANNRAT